VKICANNWGGHRPCSGHVITVLEGGSRKYRVHEAPVKTTWMSAWAGLDWLVIKSMEKSMQEPRGSYKGTWTVQQAKRLNLFVLRLVPTRTVGTYFNLWRTARPWRQFSLWWKFIWS